MSAMMLPEGVSVKDYAQHSMRTLIMERIKLILSINGFAKLFQAAQQKDTKIPTGIFRAREITSAYYHVWQALGGSVDGLYFVVEDNGDETWVYAKFNDMGDSARCFYQ